MNKLMTVSATLAVASSLFASGCVVHREREVIQTTRPAPVVRHDVVVQRPPMPQARVEVRTIAPGPTYHWVDGHYEWNGAAWEWQQGYWAP
jgi:hypothetical protein